jgi:tetratricopeptide (TPR) repeat protein
LATVHLKLGHFPKALEVVRRGLSVAPENLDLIDEAITIHLAQGDRRAADSMIQARPASVDEAALAVYLAVYGDLYWLLDARQQRLALEAPVDQYPDRAAWGLALAEIHRSSGRLAASRVYADSACLALEEQLKAAPGDPLRHSLMGLSLAYLGRKTEAIREGEKGLAMVLNRIGGPYARLQLVRIYLLTGEPAKALDELEVLIPMRSSYTPAWLRLDPTFDPIRKEPRF